MVAQAGAWAAAEQPAYRNLTSHVILKEPIKKALAEERNIEVMKSKNYGLARNIQMVNIHKYKSKSDYKW